MKIIQAMKEKRDLQAKMQELRAMILKHAAYASVETPVYGTKENQTAQVRAWLQSHEDCGKRWSELALRITRTNIVTLVTIAIGGKEVTKTLAEWVLRRQLLAELDRQAWQSCNDRTLKEGKVKMAADSEPVDITIVRCYDPQERDVRVELYRSEPSIIDGALEVANAVTDLVE